MRRRTIGKANPKYFVLAQYTRHIRQGMTVLSTGEIVTVAAWDPKSRKLVIVAQNLQAAAREKVYDLSKFNLPDGAVQHWLTEPKGTTRYAQQTDARVASRRLTVSLPPFSIQTFEVNNVGQE
jgi:galactan endo-1,6-beta-galactosidase